MSLRSERLAGRLRGLVSAALLRFVLVGTINTAVDVVIYTVLVQVGTALVPANLISTTCGLVVSFVLNRSFVFRAGGAAPLKERLRQVLLFVVTTGFGLWVLQPLLILLVTSLLVGTPIHGLALVLIPKLAATCVTLVWNYLLYSLLVFTRTRVDSSV